MLKFCALLTLVMCLPVKAASVEIKGGDYLKKVTQEALGLLPSAYLDSVEGTVIIGESKLQSDHLLSSANLCQIKENVTYGITVKNRITISSRLIEIAQSDARLFPCGHKSFRNLLKAVIVHELTHVKDNQEKISSDPDFQRIVGIKRVTRNTRASVMNQNLASSPDPYEFQNLEESLAVNTEYFLLDPEFECRKPATANYLSRKLGIPLKGECEKNHTIIAQSAFIEDNYQLPVSLDPGRVYQIHYLFAGKGKALMSRWGHAMFRLVICAPFRKVAGPECLDDVSHHLALSYRAAVSDMNLSYVKGLFGGYPSQLFVLRYLEVQQEYTKFELRDLFSVPLKMTLKQKQDFLDLTLERYWTYQGKYYFLDNNCGTETVKHLKVALSPDEERLVSSLTPLKTYQDILRHSEDLADENIRGLSRKEMIERRFLAPSMLNEIQGSYQFLQKYIPEFSERSVHSFIKNSKASERLRSYERLLSESSSLDEVQLKQLSMRMSHFERYLAGRFLMDLPKKAMEIMDNDQELKTEIQKMGQGLKLLSLQPWEVIKSAYGVPLNSEFISSFQPFLDSREREVRISIEGQMSSLDKILEKKYFETELEELEYLKKIKKLTIDFINQLNRV